LQGISGQIVYWVISARPAMGSSALGLPANSSSLDAALMNKVAKQKGLATVDADEEELQRQQLLDKFAKQKGLATFDDEEEEQQQLRVPQAHHELHLHVEYCTALRPSRSLRGSTQKYVDKCEQLEELLLPLKGDGMLFILPNQQENAGGSADRPHSSCANRVRLPARPASADHHMRPSSPLKPVWPENSSSASNSSWPRIGAFEVSFTLRNNLLKKVVYGPCLVYSKLQSGRWPLHTKLKSTIEQMLQEALAKDELEFGVEQTLRQQISKSDGVR